MMKKLITSLITVSIIGTFILTSAPEAQAQQWFGGYCCDMTGAPRCVLNGLFPLGNPCYCFGLGSGYVCRKW